MNNKKGMSHVMTAVLVLIVAMVLSLVLSYASMMTVIQLAENNTQRVLDGFVTHNSKLIYASLKNGNDFTEDLNERFYIDELSFELSLDKRGNTLYYKDEQGNVIYQITNPNVVYEWADTLKLRATYNIILPLDFAGKHITNIIIPQKVISYYNLKQ